MKNSKKIRQRAADYNPGFNQKYDPDDDFRDIWRKY